MKNLRNRFERFCYQNRHIGIPNLMLYVTIANALVYCFTQFSQNPILYELLSFDRALILQGQVWRLFTYAFTFNAGNILWTVIGLICYYSLGRSMENSWGTLRFNLFYLSGIVLMDVYSMLFHTDASIFYLNMSLLLGYATMYPDARFLILFVIPVKAWILALIYLIILAVPMFTTLFPYNLFPLVALLNYFLFFGKDVLNVIPLSWRINIGRLFRKKPANKSSGKTIPFPSAGSYEASTASVKAPYTHKCTICGRTDVSNPELEFRYCSRCNGYYCYCEEHINNHSHIQ